MVYFIQKVFKKRLQSQFVPLLWYKRFPCVLKWKLRIRFFKNSTVMLTFSGMRRSNTASFNKFQDAVFDLNDFKANLFHFLWYKRFPCVLKWKLRIRFFLSSTVVVTFSGMRRSNTASFNKFQDAVFDLNDFKANLYHFLWYKRFPCVLKWKIHIRLSLNYTVVFSGMRWSNIASFNKFQDVFFDLTTLKLMWTTFYDISDFLVL